VLVRSADITHVGITTQIPWNLIDTNVDVLYYGGFQLTYSKSNARAMKMWQDTLDATIYGGWDQEEMFYAMKKARAEGSLTIHSMGGTGGLVSALAKEMASAKDLNGLQNAAVLFAVTEPTKALGSPGCYLKFEPWAGFSRLSIQGKPLESVNQAKIAVALPADHYFVPKCLMNPIEDAQAVATVRLSFSAETAVCIAKAMGAAVKNSTCLLLPKAVDTWADTSAVQLWRGDLCVASVDGDVPASLVKEVVDCPPDSAASAVLFVHPHPPPRATGPCLTTAGTKRKWQCAKSCQTTGSDADEVCQIGDFFLNTGEYLTAYYGGNEEYGYTCESVSAFLPTPPPPTPLMPQPVTPLPTASPTVAATAAATNAIAVAAIAAASLAPASTVVATGAATAVPAATVAATAAAATDTAVAATAAASLAVTAAATAAPAGTAALAVPAAVSINPINTIAASIAAPNSTTTTAPANSTAAVV
jgi:hypothetical protein